ncbi:hypothetical protein ELI55_24615 [Rhizobium ruizarguesonis]|uniref:hypothetical protein n=1 Tax=Rhizobium ruizarguesonis TaxID=2081791 RepID=UPI00102F9F82|nr:hypothetical protein [Rhizobium ruizarguesonis]TAU07807.1 hypothetical protein ELI55_24615 [Rhizobium ruizarguesonis]
MTNALNLDCQNETALDPYLEQLVAFIRMNAEMERGFGPAGALLRYGKTFEPAGTNPAWFTRRPAKQCFDNVTQVLISRLAACDTGVRYAEGYAMDAELPIPMQHAWLVDADNKVIDPTWRDVADNLYFGIVFETKFFLDLLRTNKSAGILVDAVAMRRHYATAELFELGLARFATV